MKVLFLNSVCGTGSTGRIVSGTAELLQRAGNQVKIVYGIHGSEQSNCVPSVCISSKADYYFHNALSRFTDHAGLYSRCPTKRILSEIENFQPDIIHIHQLHGYYVNYEILFNWLKQRQIPVIWTLHDCWSFTGHCTHFSSVGCNQWKTLCKECTQLHRYPKCYLKGDVSNNFLRKKKAFSGLEHMVLTAPSQWLAQLVKESFLGEYPIETIHNGINTAVFHPHVRSVRERYYLSDKKIILGVANVWSRMKGLDDLIGLAEHLPEKYKLVLIGLTEDQLQKLPAGILGIQRTADMNELAQWYASADVFVNPTYEDTYPTVNLEAQACGTRVVTYKTDGAPETIADGNGIVVPQGDVAALESAIYRAIELGKLADDFDYKQFDMALSLERYAALYDKILQRK